MEIGDLIPVKSRADLRIWLQNNLSETDLAQRLSPRSKKSSRTELYGQWNDNGRLLDY